MTITILMRKRLRAGFNKKEIKSSPDSIASEKPDVKKRVSFEGYCN